MSVYQQLVQEFEEVMRRCESPSRDAVYFMLQKIAELQEDKDKKITMPKVGMTLEQIDDKYADLKMAELAVKKAKKENRYRLQPLYRCCRTCSHSRASIYEGRKCALLANDKWWTVNNVEDMAICNKYKGQSETEED